MDSETSESDSDKDISFEINPPCTQDALNIVERDVEKFEKVISKKSNQTRGKVGTRDNFEKVLKLGEKIKELTNLVVTLQKKVDDYEEKEFNRICSEAGDALEKSAYAARRERMVDQRTSTSSTNVAKEADQYSTPSSYSSSTYNSNHGKRSNGTVRSFYNPYKK